VPTASELEIVNASSFATSTTSSPNNNRTSKQTYKVNVTYDMAALQYSDVYPSLADWWSAWISEYVNDSSGAPRLLIRFEDLLFHAEYVMSQIIECAHGSTISMNSSSSDSTADGTSLLSLLKPYDYKLTKAKTHGRSTDFLGAIFQYARQDTKRSGGMTAQDLVFARGGGANGGDDDNEEDSSRSNDNNKTSSRTTAPLYPKLMQMFSYTHPPANTPLRIQYRLMNAPS
jgi:hypothetical protein